MAEPTSKIKNKNHILISELKNFGLQKLLDFGLLDKNFGQNNLFTWENLEFTLVEILVEKYSFKHLVP